MYWVHGERLGGCVLALAVVLLPSLAPGRLLAAAAASDVPTDAGKLVPEKAPAGFFQQVTSAFVIQTDVSQGYLSDLTRQCTSCEQRMLELLKIPEGFLKGNDKTVRLDNKIAYLTGDLLSTWGYKPWIEVRVYKKYEDFVDEYFDRIDLMESRINSTPLKKETPEQRATRRLTEGVPGAYYMRIADYDNKYRLRLIRAFVGSQSTEEVEATILHEMGHLIQETFLFEFAGAPKKGKEAEKRGTPAWLGEGFAQLFEVNWSGSRESAKKKKRYGAMIYEAVKSGDAYPFSEFINVTNAHNLQAVAGNPLKSTINYAQSYSVMKFMVDVNWDKFLVFLKNCRAYNLDDLGKRKKTVGELYTVQDRAFKDAFTVSIGEVEEHWKKHVLTDQEKELKRDPSGYYWCGEYFLRRKGPDFLAKAEERFKLAAEGAPVKGEGYLGLGRVALMKNQTPAALTNLKKAAELSPKDEDAFYYLGHAQLRAGQAKEAMASFEQAVKLYPLYHQAHAGLASAYFDARAYAKAKASYEAAFQISKAPQHLFNMGQSAFFAKDYEEAQKGFAAYANIFTKDAEGHFWYGLAAWRLGQRDFAVKKLQEAVKEAPGQASYKDALAMAQKGEQYTFALESPKKELDPKALPVPIPSIIPDE